MRLETNQDISEEAIREEHLRLAVMIDLITDEWNDHQPVDAYIAELRLEFDQHSLLEETVLAERAPHVLEHHREGHLKMADLLRRLAEENSTGGDIRPVLNEMLVLFTGQLMPDDAIFLRH
jgi:hemerythrin